MKKSVLFIMLLFVLGLGIIGAYAIDMSRMKNNKAVIFSTWGYSYAPPEDAEHQTME